MKQLFYKLLLLFPLCYSASAQTLEDNHLKSARLNSSAEFPVMLAIGQANNLNNTAYLINYPKQNNISACAINSNDGTS